MESEIIKQEIKKLLDKYNRVFQEKQLSKYNEEMTKKDFILPLFRILGWNTEDSSEVTAEEKISKKRVDYGFRINGIPKFFLEAKALKEDLDNIRFVEQAINYAWHKGCTWAILTNFESIKVYNAEWKTGTWQSHFMTIPCESFLERFDDLWLLSKESFEQGLLDKQAEKYGKRTKKTTVDKQLLNDFTRFRELLSKNITKLNQSKNITEEELDEAVQRILDRLIFIRNCEDRELEAKTLISSLREWESKGKGQLIKSLREVFAYFDKKYNSKIFANHLCDSLDIDNEILHEIIEGLYYTKDKSVSYDFSAIEADVLGNIYEQYLGHILKKGEKRAKLTENHAHRKEQGIYYTPTYIVDYIVRNTLGELLKDKKVNVEKIRVLDPACGSGSFLIKAFDVLNEYYLKHDKNYSQTQIDFKTGLPFTTKVKILKNNIFGVDLDKQAVEIAQLNLLLKIAERGHRLPLLQENIKCGNSLIDDPKIAGDKAFKWEEEFPEVMKEGGFDVVFGNPPYGIVFKENEKHFIEEKLPTFRRNNDLYVAFMEKGINLLKEGGLFSFIIPNTYLIGPYFDNLKRFILEKTKIIKILDLGVNHVFQDPNVFNSIIILQKESNKSKREKNKIKFFDVPLLKNSDFFKLESVSFKTEIIQSQFNDLSWKPKNKIIEKITMQKDKIIDDVCYVKDVGFNYWSIGRGKKRGDSIGSRILYDGERKNQNDIPYLKGRDINRYNHVFGNHWLKHDYEKFLNKKTDIFRFSPEFLEVSPKIIYRQTADRIIASIDFDKYYLDKTVHLIIPKENVKLNLLFLLGVINSKLMLYFYRNLVREEGRTFAQVKTVYIKKIPLKFNEYLENKISELVNKMLSLNKRLNEIGDKKTDERARIEEEIKKTDAEIDELVYKIYGITEEEKKIIEEALK
jgi:type I restriction-modification system DNA methylase subunit